MLGISCGTVGNGVYICIVINYNHVQAVRHQYNLEMNNKYRFLPRLYSQYLLKKDYDAHQQRINKIRNTDPISRLKEIEHRHEQKTLNSTSKHKEESETIKLSPRAKKAKRERQMQNLRLLDRIQNCAPTIISKTKIEQSNAKHDELKQRMSKFVYITRSQKILLKCSHSLSKLQQRQRQKDKQARLSVNHHPKTRYTQIQIEVEEIQHKDNPFSKKGSLDKLYFKDKQKATKDFQRALSRIYSKQKLQNLKDGHWNEANRKKKRLRRNKKNETQPQE